MSLVEFTNIYLSVPEFIRLTNKNFDALSRDDLLRRTNDEIKKFIEEIIPISKFLKFFEMPGRNLKFCYCDGDQNFDGVLKVDGDHVKNGSLLNSYYVEVTTISDGEDKDHLKREALLKYGYVYDDDNIAYNKKKKGEIIQSVCIRDRSKLPSLITSKIIKRISKKNKKKYPENCILIIENNLMMKGNLNLKEWHDILISTKEEFKNNDILFSHIYIIASSNSNLVFQIY